MFTKADYIKALQKVGFVKQDSKRSDGARINFSHSDYPLIQVCLVDHKNTKELDTYSHNDLINGMCIVALLNSVEGDVVVEEDLNSFLSCLDKEMKKTIKTKLTKLNLKDNYALMAILPSKLRYEMQKFINDLNNQAIISYFSLKASKRL